MRISLTPTPVTHPPAAHARSHVREPKRVVVIGGGIAGLSAATVLAERGVCVTVIEKDGVLGGRASAWTETLADGTSVEMERGFHGFFRQYYNLRALLKRIDPPLSFLTELSDYPLLGPGDLRESFSGLPKAAPFNLVSLVRRTSTLTLSDLRRAAARPALSMMAFDQARVYETYDAMSAREYLDSLRFPKLAKQMLFDVFAHSFFNPEDKLSAAELLMMFHFYFLGNPEGLVFDVMNEPFSLAWWKPWQRYLERRLVSFRVETRAQTIARRENGFIVETTTGPEPADAIVLALDVRGLKGLMRSSQAVLSAAVFDAIGRLDVTHPFAVYRAWLDRPTRAGRHPFVGTTGLGITDNISLYHEFEGESRRWAQEHRGSVVELHAYAVDPNRSETSIRAEFLRCLHALYPETSTAGIVDERFLLRADCPSFEPGSYAKRPTVTCAGEGIALAGDFVRMPFPTALMERAASSGIMAANHVLGGFGVRGEALLSVPLRGILASFGGLLRAG